jgi:hypothetical protein
MRITKDDFGQPFILMIAKLREHSFGLISIVALTMVVVRNLIFSPNFPAGDDMLPLISRASYFTKDLAAFSIWTPESFGGVKMFTLLELLSALNMILQDSVLLTRIFIVTTFFFSGISMYFFAYHYTKRKVASLCCSIIFVMSQWYTSQLTSGHLNFAFAYALSPTLFFLLDKALKKGSFKRIIIFSLATALISLLRAEIIFYFIPFIMLYTVLTIFMPYSRMSRRTMITHSLKTLSIGGAFNFLFVAFQWAPMLFGVRPEFIATSSWVPVEEHYAYSLELFESILGMSSEFGYAQGFYPPFRYSLYCVLVSIPVILAVSAIFFSRNKQTLFFLFSALISVFFSKGPHEPLGGAYLWLISNIPFFGALHVPNRWLIITGFSYAFLAGITIDALYTKLVRKRVHSTLINGRNSYKRFLRPLPQIFLILIIIPPFFSSWYVVLNGLQTWHPPKEYVEPYLWIADQQGDFRVVTVPYQNPWIRTELRRERDLGIYSTLFHGRPVVGLARWWSGSQGPMPDFLSYTYALGLTNGTNKLMKVLGALNVRYLVVQAYLPYRIPPNDPYPSLEPDWQHYFFSKQEGIRPRYVSENSTVYENEFWTPHFFAAQNCAIVIGGKEAFVGLSTIDTFDFSEWGLLFAHQISDEGLTEPISRAQAIIFVNSEPLDLAMRIIKDAIRIKAVDCVTACSQWIVKKIPEHWLGYPILNDHLLSTSQNSSLSVPIRLDEGGEYDIWIRVLCGESRGKLSIMVDGTKVGEMIPYTPSGLSPSILKWERIGSANLSIGEYALLLMNNVLDVTRRNNDVDEILIVKRDQLESATSLVAKIMQENSQRIVSIIEGEQLPKYNVTSIAYWKPAKYSFNASNGYVLSKNITKHALMLLNYNVPSTGRYGLALRAMTGMGYGTLNITINGNQTRSLDFASNENGFKWLNLSPIYLQTGNNTFELYGTGKVEIDQMVIFSLKKSENTITLNDIFKVRTERTKVSHQKIDVTKYVVHVKTTSPIFLIFSEAYNDLWKAYLDDVEIESAQVNYFTNGFYIPKTGKYDVVVEFTGQRYVVYGGIISILSIASVAAYIAFETKINYLIRKTLRTGRTQKEEPIEDNGLTTKQKVE